MRRLSTFPLTILLLAALAVPVTAQTPTTNEAPATSVRTDLLPGAELTVEEVEPGVFRVVSDGVRTWFGYDTDFNDIVAGHDGSILFLEQGEETPRRRASFFRLGSEESFQVPTPGYSSLAVSSDGTVWASGTRNDRYLIHSLDDGTWTRRLRTRVPDSAHDPDFTVAPDGTAWVAIEKDDGNRLVIRRLGTDGWQRFARPTLGDYTEGLPYGDLVVTESGGIWWVPPHLGHEVLFDDEGPRYVRGEDRLLRLKKWDDGSEWLEVTPDALVYALGNSAVEIGSDGTVWYAGVEPRVDGETATWDAGIGGGGTIAAPGDSFLMRYDGAEWQRWGPDDGVPSLTWSWSPQLEVAPDGGLWVVAPETWVRRGDAKDLPFDGIARFDGSTWHYFLAGHDVGDWDVAPDGSVWLRADGALYVITPEAVAGTE